MFEIHPEEGYSRLLLIFFEVCPCLLEYNDLQCFTLFLDSLQTVVKYAIHLVDIYLHQDSIWDERGVLIYYTGNLYIVNMELNKNRIYNRYTHTSCNHESLYSHSCLARSRKCWNHRFYIVTSSSCSICKFKRQDFLLQKLQKISSSFYFLVQSSHFFLEYENSISRCFRRGTLSS